MRVRAGINEECAPGMVTVRLTRSNRNRNRNRIRNRNPNRDPNPNPNLSLPYGSVKHSLIHFSLEWYHVPKHFCELMWRYYKGLMASMMIGDAQTAWFRFSIGVFQGCTIPTVLFNAGFDTSFEHLTRLEEECRYQFRDQSIQMLCVLVTGYADDIHP